MQTPLRRQVPPPRAAVPQLRGHGAVVGTAVKGDRVGEMVVDPKVGNELGDEDGTGVGPGVGDGVGVVESQR